MTAERVDGDTDPVGVRTWRQNTVELSHLITVPQGFTVAVAGSVAQCVCRHGFRGFLELEPNIDRPVDALDPAQHHLWRGQPEIVTTLVSKQGEHGGDHYPSRRGCPDRVGNEGRPAVCPTDLRRLVHRSDGEVARLGVQEPARNRLAVETGAAQSSRPTHPRDECGGAAVGQEGVLANRDVTHPPLHIPARRQPAVLVA
jgi:hypothetical protein